MINFIISENFYSLFAGIGLMAAFLMTCVCITKFNYLLPKDAGRDFAHDGKLSAGKPRGAGIIFILVFAAVALLFSELSVEIVIYIVLVIAEMLTGYLDDASEKPWNEYKKGLLDLLVAVVLSLTFMHYNSSTIEFAIPGISVTIPPVVFCLLSIVLIWVSINVTNCSDGRPFCYVDDHHVNHTLYCKRDERDNRQLLLFDLAVCNLFAWVSVVQCCSEPSDDGGCRIPSDGNFYCNRSVKDRKSIFIYFRCIRADCRWRNRDCQSSIASFLEDQDLNKCSDSPT